MASGGYAVAVFNAGDRLLAGLDAVKEVSDMKVELFGAGAFLLHGRCPGFGFCSRHSGAAAGLALEAGDGGVGVDFHIGDDLEAASINGHTALGAEEFERSGAGRAAAGFAVGPGGGPGAEVVEGILGVGRFAVVLQRIAAAD